MNKSGIGVDAARRTGSRNSRTRTRWSCSSYWSEGEQAAVVGRAAVPESEGIDGGDGVGGERQTRCHVRDVSRAWNTYSTSTSAEGLNPLV